MRYLTLDKLYFRGLRSSLLMFTLLVLNGCGGAGPAQDEMTSAIKMIEQVRKTKCPHESLQLAEEAYKRSQDLYDQKKYDEARAQARVAKQFAKEAAQANTGKPCETAEVIKTPPVSIIPENKTEIEISEENDKQELKTIYFKYDSSHLSSESIANIEINLMWIQANPKSLLTLEGHCDDRGDDGYNLALSHRRGKVVEGYLKKMGVDPVRLQVIGYGSEQLQSYRTDEKGHRLNRRVEFKVRD